MNPDIIYTTSNNTIIIYETVYEDEVCYCIEHVKSKHKEIINHDEALLKSIIEKMEMTGALVCDKKRQERRMLKFKEKNGQNSISLRKYVYAHYHNLSTDELDYKRIDLLDSSCYSNNLIDLRKKNLFAPQECGKEWVDVICRPNNPKEKYIITYQNGHISIQDYTAELYSVLADRSVCVPAPNRGSRQRIQIHYKHGRKGYMLMNLSRFVYMYYQDYGSEGFICRIPETSRGMGTGNDCAHVNADNWNNCACNLMAMKQSLNIQMRDYIKAFSGRYSAFPVMVREDGREIVILEIRSGSRFFYYKCCSSEDYLDLQKVLLGKAVITTHVKTNIVNTRDQFSCHIPTPKEEVRNADLVSNDVIKQFWKWCDNRDRLLNLYNTVPSLFTEWIACEKNMSVQILLNQIVPVFIGDIVREV